MARSSQGTFSVFKQADAEGYLDKLNTGITSRFIGKTRFWCELYDTTFYTFKESKHSTAASPRRSRASSESNVIDMKVVQMVRKVTSDKMGTQFEILCKNKSQMFCAGSVAECDKWIKTLQRAMTLKDQETPPPFGLADNPQPSNSKEISQVSICDYETIEVFSEEGTAHVQMRQSTTSESAYAEIGFHNLPVNPKKIPSPFALNMDSASLGHLQAVSEQTPQAAVAGRDEDLKEDCRYAQVGEKSIQADQLKVTPKINTESSDAGGEDSYGYATVQPRSTRIVTAPPLTASTTGNGLEGDTDRPRTPGDGAESNDDDDNDEVDELYMDAISHRDPGPIPQLPHPLTLNDVEPLKTVQEFLTQNRQICRRSYYSSKLTEDPVASIKKLLKEISLG